MISQVRSDGNPRTSSTHAVRAVQPGVVFGDTFNDQKGISKRRIKKVQKDITGITWWHHCECWLAKSDFLLNQLALCQDLQRIIESSEKLKTLQDKMAMAVAAQPYVVAMLVPAAMMMPSNAQVGPEIGQEVKRSGFLNLRNLRMTFELKLFENLI